MEIYVDGGQLHINKGDVELQFTNIRFAEGAVPDEWSTEIELPNDGHNISLLGGYGLLDRADIFNHRIYCSVMIDSIARDGYLQVTSIEEYVIKIRVYLNAIPYEILDKKVCEYYPHNDVVFRWDRYSPITTNIAGVDEGIIEYDYTETDFYTNILAQWHSSVNVQKILSLIQTEEDITLPTVDNTLYELSARKKVCPSNPHQVMMGYLEHYDAITDKNLEVCSGQHITNDAKTSWSYSNFVWDANFNNWDYLQTNLNWLEAADKVEEITFNRHCSAHIKVYASANIVGGILIPKKNGESLAPATSSAIPVITTSSWTPNSILIFDSYVGFEDGDILTFHYSGSAQVEGRRIQYSIVIDYDSYTWDENDYDVDLVYVPAPFLIWCLVTGGGVTTYYEVHDFTGDGDGTQGVSDYSFTYFGAYTNLEREMSVREFLTNLCWIHNQKLHLDRNELIFQSANQKGDITSNIKSIEPFTDKLGQKNKIGFRKLDDEDNVYELEFDIDNEYLEPEIVLHENGFYTADIIPQYSYTMTYSEATTNGEHWITDVEVNFEDLSPIIMEATNDGRTYKLVKLDDIQGFGLSDLVTALTIQAEAIGRYSEYDYVYILGHKYMMIEGSYNPDTNITAFTAIQCYSQSVEHEPTVNVNITQISNLRATSADITFTITES